MAWEEPSSFDDRRTRSGGKKCDQPLEAGEDKEMDSPLEHLRRKMQLC